MKTVILYRPNSDHERAVLTFVHDFQAMSYGTIDLLSTETRDGAFMAEVYGITSYPAVVSKTNDGKLLKLWQGDMLPLMSEVGYYSRGQE